MVIISFSPQYFETLKEIFEFWNTYTESTKYSKKIQEELNRTIRIIKNNISAFPSVFNSEYLENSRRIKKAVILKNFSLYYEVTSENSVTILMLRDSRRDFDFTL